MMVTDSTAPNRKNASFRESSVAENGRFPTYSFLPISPPLRHQSRKRGHEHDSRDLFVCGRLTSLSQYHIPAPPGEDRRSVSPGRGGHGESSKTVRPFGKRRDDDRMRYRL